MGSPNRVVVSGLGIVCSIGKNVAEVKGALQKREDGLGPLSLFSSSHTHPVAEIKIKQPEAQFRTSFLTQMAVCEAIQSSGFWGSTPRSRVGISLSTSTAGMLEMEEAFLLLRQGKEANVPFSKTLSLGLLADEIALQYAITGPRFLFSTACSSSANAILYGLDQIREGRCDICIVGGTDSLCRLTYYGFQSLKVMSETKCSPFDKSRQGMNLGEGSAIIILESLSHAQKRTAPIYAELLGGGMSADAYHMSAPDPAGKGAYEAMKRALMDAHIGVADVDYVSAHGTATLQNDEIEAKAVHALFPQYKERPWVSSLKSYWGHSLAASGAMAFVAATITLQEGFIPPTLRLTQVDPACPLRHPGPEGVWENVSTILVNSFGFGGNNASLILRKFYES